MKTLPEKESKGESLSVFIEEIKNNLAHEIEAMAERIIQDRKNLEQEEEALLISQRENEEQKRFEKARKEIGEYLSMKKEVN
jgi:cytidylate kinase